VWIRTHGVTAVLWQLVAHHVSPSTVYMSREDAHTMRCRLRRVVCSFDSPITGALPTASSPEWGLAGPKEEVARVVPLVLSKDKTASRGSKRWRELFYRVGRVAGIAEPAVLS